MFKRSITLTFALTCLAAPLAGCPAEKGPMEKAGESIDKAAKKTVDTAKEAVEKTGEKLEEAGKNVRDSVE